MGRAPRTTGTPLLDWQPPEVAPSFEDVQVRSASLRGRIAKAVSTVLKDCDLGRAEIAFRMGEYLSEDVSLAMLDAYASEAREDHVISVVRLIALFRVTEDARLIQVLTDGSDYRVIPAKYMGAIKAAIIKDKISELEREAALADREWKGPR
jgi:hypothetical protein